MRKFTTIILFWSFLLLTIPLKAQNTDIDLLTKINSPFLRNYSVFISNSAYVVTAAVPATIGVISLIKKDDALLKDALYIGTSYMVNAVFTYGLKYSVGRARPYETYPDLLDAPYTEFTPSFPSGHTSFAFTTATALSIKYPKWYVMVPSYLWAGSVAYSRMKLAVHYPSDVMAGALLGAGSAYLTYRLNEWFWKKNDNKILIGPDAFWH